MTPPLFKARLLAPLATGLMLIANGCTGPQPASTSTSLGPPLKPAIDTPAPQPLSPDPATPSPAQRATDTIMVAGTPISIGTRVVLFDEPGGYNAYHGPSYFNHRQDKAPAGLQTSPNASPMTMDRADLERVVDRVVLHYDVSGLASRCFHTLQQERGLSCHFLLDVDGTVYQTLDLRERAWHAGTSNSRSVGIEIANVGAYPKADSNRLAKWYRPHAQHGTQLILPADSGVRHPHRAQAPARAAAITGFIHGRQLIQYDFTDAQYASLIKLVAALCHVFPRITPDAPRVNNAPNGPVLSGLMSPADRTTFGGIVGHHHLTKAKSDPGPAFDWPRFLAAVQAHTEPPRSILTPKP